MSHARISRKEAAFRDQQRSSWFRKGDGDNRASIRKAIAAIIDRKERMAKRELMVHRRDIAYLRTTGLPLQGDGRGQHRGPEFNRAKRLRRAR